MQWEFRKTLENFDNYKSHSQNFITEVDQGNTETLDIIVREIKLVLEDPKERVQSKVLAMRFARDIMILGKNQVVQALTKIVSEMLKVCSYKLQSDDPDRGETIFLSRMPEGLSEEERKKYEALGSTYFTLNLQSIYHWAKWIPVDENGSQSIYSKGYNTLLERGVTFQDKFHYYKSSDTQKFNQTYKVEFFSESSVDYDSRSSRVTNVDQILNADNSKVFFPGIVFDSAEKIKNYLYSVENDKKNRFQKLEELNRAATDLHERKFNSKDRSFHGKDKNDKKWLEKYMISFNALMSKKIDYSNFISRVMSEDLEISQRQEAQLSEVSRKSSAADISPFKKVKTTAKRQQMNTVKDQQKEISNKLKYEDLLKTQQVKFMRRIDSLKKDVKELEIKLASSDREKEEEKNQLVQEYEERINLIKRGIVDNSGDKTQFLMKQNDKLRDRINQLEKASKDNPRQKSLELQRDELNLKIQQILVENQKLKNSLRNNDLHEQNGQLLRKIKQMERQMREREKQKSEMDKSSLISPSQLNKKNKQLSNLSEELKLYKIELGNQRERSQKQRKSLESKMEHLVIQNKELKEKNLFLQKKLDLKDIEATELSEQVKLFKLMDKETNNLMKNYLTSPKSGKNIRDQGKMIGSDINKPVKSYAYQYKKYEKLRNTFKNEKEKYLRFCRCCLKKKDLIMKENQFELGIITQVFSDKEIKFMLHFTNMSDSQVENIEIFVQPPAFIKGQLSSESIFCIQSQEQEKITLKCEFIEGNFISCFRDLYQPTYLRFHYKKFEQFYSYELPIPFLLFKTLKCSRSDPSARAIPNSLQVLNVNYSKKLLPDLKYLSTYFPEIEETYKNKFECEFMERSTKMRVNLSFQFSEISMLHIEVQPLGKERLGGPEKEVLEDLMGFLEFCFKK